MATETNAAQEETEARINTNTEIWESVSRTDPVHTKEFKRPGGFQGTAINATYLISRATEMFGPVGMGWGYEVEQEELMEGVFLDERNRELIHKIKIKVWYKWNGKTGEFCHYGQTTFVGMRGKYVFTDEEAPKKSLTDALTKALSMLGFSADVHMGLYDDNKYVNETASMFAEQRAKKAEAAKPKINADQASTIKKLIASSDTDIVRFLDYYRVNNIEDIPADQYERIAGLLKKKQEKLT